MNGNHRAEATTAHEFHQTSITLSISFHGATQQHPAPPASRVFYGTLSPNRFLCFLLAHHKHIVDLSSSYFDLSYMCAQSRLVFQSPWPMSQRERISHLIYDFDASSIVWSFDAIEMADWFKDGWRRWLKGGHSSTFKWGVAILHINNITPKICCASRAWLVIRIIKPSTGLQNWKAANC